MSEKIIAALKGLEPRNNDHWTAEGLPSLKALGIEGLKRADVSAVAPHFTRDNLVIETPAAKEERTREEEIAAAQALAKAQLGTIEEQKERLRIVIQQRERELVEAQKRHREAIEDLDVILREEHRAGAARKPIHDIMDFVKSQREHREARAAKA